MENSSISTDSLQPGLSDEVLSYKAKLIKGLTIFSGVSGTLTLDDQVLKFTDSSGQVLLQTPYNQIENGAVSVGVINLTINNKRYTISLEGSTRAITKNMIPGALGMWVGYKAEQGLGQERIIQRIKAKGGSISDNSIGNIYKNTLKWLGIIFLGLIIAILLSVIT